MTLIEFQRLVRTYHFKVVVIRNGQIIIQTMYDNLPYKYCNNPYEVVDIDTECEIANNSPITRELSVRPILVVTIEGEE